VSPGLHLHLYELDQEHDALRDAERALAGKEILPQIYEEPTRFSA
jgi:hypothetical protein